MNNNFWKRILICLVICFFIFVVAFFVSKEIARQKEWKGWKEKREQLERRVEKSCPHHFSNLEKDRLIEKLRLITGWNCDYCGERVIEQGNDYITNRLKEDKHFFLIKEHLVECEEAKKVIDMIDGNKVNGFDYDGEKSLKKKGYSKESINKTKSWGLVEKINLPDLKEKERIGVVKELSVMMELENNSSHLKIKSGKVFDGVIFLAPRTSPITYQNFSDLLVKNNFGFFYSICGSKEGRVCERIIVEFFVQRLLKKQKEWNYNVYFLETDEEGIASELVSYEGNSSLVSLYLSLLSSYYQKPISEEVAAAATIEVGRISKYRCVQCFWENELTKNSKENFSENKVVSVGGLEYKIPAAVQAGVKKLILATEQKEDYEKVVPQEIKEKLTVYYVKNVEELEGLFWEGQFS